MNDRFHCESIESGGKGKLSAERVPALSGLSRKHWRFIVGILLLSILLIGCASTPRSDHELPTREDVVERNIRRRIEEGESALAIQRLSGLREDILDEALFESLWSDAIDGLEQEFSSHIAAGEWAEALARYRSLSTVGVRGQEHEEWDLNALYVSWADAFRERGDEVAALNLFLKAPRFSDSPEEVLIEYGRLASEQNHRFAVKEIREALLSAGYDVPPSLDDYLGSVTDISDMLVGTATVEVDRGIRIQGGIGRRDQVMGSGFFIDKRGYLITNYHVIESEVDPRHDGYSRLYIRLSENPGQRIPAKVVGYDRILDVALIKVEVEPSYVFSLTDIRELRPGATVYAMGSPGGLSSSISSGIISATGRRYLQLGEAMQIDAALNPGNSGGPIVNESGELVGVAFAGLPQFENVNFAVPSLWIQYVVPRLYEGDQVEHSWFGMSVHERRGTLEVTYVMPGSPAHEAGIEVGDRIGSIDGESVATLASAQELIVSRQKGSLLRVSYERNGQRRQSLLTLVRRPDRPVLSALERDSQTAVIPPLFGMTVSELSSGLFRRNYVVDRVFSGGVADETGLSSQDPFTLQDMVIDEDRGIAILRISIRQRRAGFITQGIQLAALLDTDNFI